MKWFFGGLTVILLIMIAYNHFTAPFVNHWTLTMVFGKKGAGKTTYLTKLALKHAAAGWTVYSTVDIPFTYKFNPSDLGVYSTPANLVNPFSSDYRLPDPHSVSKKMYKLLRKIFRAKPNGSVLILVDEVGMIWDNRNFKSFSETTRDWFKLQRHYRCKCYLFSQSFDVDKKIRDLCDDMWLLQSKLRVFSYGKHILRKLDIVEADGSQNSESRLVDQLRFDTILFAFMGSRILTYIPFWAQLFDSFVVPDLSNRVFDLYPSKLLVAGSPASLDAGDSSAPDLDKVTKKKFLSFLNRK